MISVVIPTSNRSQLLAQTLESIRKVATENAEVIVIENGTRDNTKEVVLSYQNRIPKLRYFYEAQPGLHVGRNKGLIEAQYEIVSFLDDDVELFPTWIEGIIESFNDASVALVGGKNLPRYEVTPPQWLVKMWNRSNNSLHMVSYLSILDAGNDQFEISPYLVFGCNFSIRKEILLKAGGFHPDGFPQSIIKFRGDGETYISRFVQQKGYKALYNPKVSVYHFVPKERMTIDYFCKRGYNQGISDSYARIRAEHYEPLVEKARKNMNKKDTLLNKMKSMKRKMKDLFFAKKPGLVDLEIQHLEQAIEKAYQAGLNYHQSEINNDPELKKWVLRQNYLDYSIR